MEVEKEVEQLVGENEQYTCSALLEEQPVKTVGITLSEFVAGPYKAVFDYDSDGEWEDVCLVMFPSEKRTVTYGYNAVLVKFNEVTSQEQLDEVIASGELETNYWPRRQELEPAIHSSLAQSYKNLDFSNSIILHCGYKAENPLLGEASLELSKIAGAIALGIAFLTLLTFLFKKRGPKDLSEVDFDAPVTNRAGLPIS